MPLGRAVLPAAEAGGEDAGPPLAIVGELQGQGTRRCPICGREFLMKPSFLGKLIRCRGCKASFRVTGAEQPDNGPVQAGDDGLEKNRQQPAAAEGQFHTPPPPVPAVSRAKPLPTVFDDMGDLIEELLPYEKVASVVRPQPAVAVIQPADSAVASVLALVAGGVCALPVTQMILWWVIGKDPLGIAKTLPSSLRWLAPAEFWN